LISADVSKVHNCVCVKEKHSGTIFYLLA